MQKTRVPHCGECRKGADHSKMNNLENFKLFADLRKSAEAVLCVELLTKETDLEKTLMSKSLLRLSKL